MRTLAECGETNISQCVCFLLVKCPAFNPRTSRCGGSHTLRDVQRLLIGPAPSSERKSHKVWVLGFYTPAILLSANWENVLETVYFISEGFYPKQ